ncbi:MAG: tRNA(Ile)-lysidine synthase [Acidobacteriaceae bacterium]|nr:tRNA(Ile)-lysidine synthase [Acidobacteriaceae bacterium]
MPVHKLPQAVLSYIQKHDLLKPGDRVGVAVSGGADSVALLRLLLELRQDLGVVLSIVHVNHQLRGLESDADEQFVSALAAKHQLEFHCTTCNVPAHAKENGLSVETAAREVRYKYFNGLLNTGGVNRIATGHTLDDQAETVLMRLIRGTGLRGFGSIQPKLLIKNAGQICGTVVRPLLGVHHGELESFLTELGQPWKQDATNNELHHTRNRIRHVLMPLLEREFNPAVAERLDEFSAIARAEEEFWEERCAELTEHMLRRDPQDVLISCLDLKLFNVQPLSIQRRVLHHWGRNAQPNLSLEFKHIEQIVELANAKSRELRRLELPEGWEALRQGDRLQFIPPDLIGAPSVPTDYEYRLHVPGRIILREAGITLEAISILDSSSESYNPDQLLDPALLDKEFIVRNWRAGDRFWPAHTKAPKKVKELLQEKHLTGSERKLWPVVVSAGELVWVRGLASPARFRASEGGPALLFRDSADRA